MKRILGLAAATAVGIVMAASAANAAPAYGACVNGLTRVDTDILIYCNGGPAAQHVSAGPARTLPSEPMYTGSIATSSSRPVTNAQPLMASSEATCKHGQYWEMQTPDQPRTMACP
jgi:hypothetical protein